VLVARRLDYEPIPYSATQLAIFKDGKAIEDSILTELEAKGTPIADRQKEVKYVFSEIFPPLIGHIDALSGNTLIEIKSFNRFSFQKLQRDKWDAIPEYLAQINTYLLCLKDNITKAVLIGKCKDTSELIELEWEFNQELADKIIDKLINIELYIQDGELPTGEFEEGSNQCRWCKFRFLCLREEKEEKDAKEETLPNLVDAASQYREGDELEKQGKSMKESAKETFLNHATSNKIDKFKTGGVSISYLGQKTKEYFDEKLLRELVPKEIIEKVTKVTKPWEDIRIRILKA